MFIEWNKLAKGIIDRLATAYNSSGANVYYVNNDGNVSNNYNNAFGVRP